MIKDHNPNWPQILIIHIEHQWLEVLGLEKNTLLILIEIQDDYIIINTIYLTVEDLNEAKFQCYILKKWS